jgi:hypothetical protein
MSMLNAGLLVVPATMAVAFLVSCLTFKDIMSVQSKYIVRRTQLWHFASTSTWLTLTSSSPTRTLPLSFPQVQQDCSTKDYSRSTDYCSHLPKSKTSRCWTFVEPQRFLSQQAIHLRHQLGWPRDDGDQRSCRHDYQPS